MLDQITPLVLTFDEEANIARTLEALSWAEDLVVVDSGSTDDTRAILDSYGGVRTFERPFDTHAGQWSFALTETGVRTEWVLALDADQILSDGLISELSELSPSTDVAAFEASFVYCVFGRPLRGTLYPPKVVLFRKSCAKFFQDGHAHRTRINGQVKRLREPVYHDDRKPLSRWLASQAGYAKLEARKLFDTPPSELSIPDRLRRTAVLSPPAVLFYCLFIKGCVLDGWPGWYYALQRMAAETAISLAVLDARLRSSASGQGGSD